jgi:hypothetical protein
MRRTTLLLLILAAVFLAVAVSGLAAQGAPPPPAVAGTPTAGAGPAEKRQPAPIEQVEVRPDASRPGRYVAHVVFGLPSGCAKPGGYEAERLGDRFEIAVAIRLPAEPRPCTAIYGTSPYEVPLTGELVPGQTYAVRVNDREATFTA